MHKAMATVTASLVIIFGLGCAIPCIAGTTGTMSGYVFDFENLKPNANATVRIASCRSESCSALVSTVTDMHGHYVFISLSPGYYYVSASDTFAQMGSSDCTLFATVEADETTYVDLGLERWTRAIRDCRKVIHFNPSGTTSIYSFDASGDLVH